MSWHQFAGFLSLLWGASFYLYTGTAAEHFNAGPPEVSAFAPPLTRGNRLERSHVLLVLPQIYPLALTVIIILIMICPFNVLHRSSRVFFLKVMVSVVATLPFLSGIPPSQFLPFHSLYPCQVLAPFGKLRFVDTYLGDLLTSMVCTSSCGLFSVSCSRSAGKNIGRCRVHRVLLCHW